MEIFRIVNIEIYFSIIISIIIGLLGALSDRFSNNEINQNPGDY
jgi:hypothetical protein